MNAPAKHALAAAMAIALPSLNEGEIYRGILVDASGTPIDHLIEIPVEDVEVNWKKAKQLAEAAGGHLADCREGRLLDASADRKRKGIFWLGEEAPDAPGYAYCQGFGYGDQYWDLKSLKLRVVAVRRVPIQQFAMGAPT